MTSSRRPGRDRRAVAALLYDGLATFEFGIVTEIFALERPEIGADWYRFATCSEEGGPVAAGGGVRIAPAGGLDVLDQAGTIVVPGWRRDGPPPAPALAAAVLRAHEAGARIVTICSGAFLPATLGLLDGRTATTHWRYAAELQARHPAIAVLPEVLYVDNGDILTSAGSAAGIDLLLHVVRQDFGPAAANTVARRLVMAPHREGGQQQFIDRPVPGPREGRLAQLLDEIRARPAEDWPVARMAGFAAMSERSFARRFRDMTGMAPGAWLIRTRVDTARDLLEGSRLQLAQIAAIAGFAAPESLARQFRRRYGVPPAAYRRSFGPTAGAE
ncbi:transcriptional regulator FtrA [Marinibaculum pumilum]|uniref:Transcriptional regulator FtrA n=1 Tax=Marinibaculum pumilum TaxID=1766165 RepID=A0ABV7KV02_9PROT